MKLSKTELAPILAAHALWIAVDPAGSRADLSRADLSRADLSRANLYGANLYGANLYGANLYGADLYGADLYGANLYGADLSRANLSRANLSRANLSRANLYGANLSRANLSRANLDAVRDLRFQIPQEGELIVYKKLSGGVIAKLRIPPEAARTATPVGRKCRAEFVEVIEGEGVSMHDRTIKYAPGLTVRPDRYDPDIRAECLPGIHFFLTREEAEEY